MAAARAALLALGALLLAVANLQFADAAPLRKPTVRRGECFDSLGAELKKADGPGKVRGASWWDPCRPGPARPAAHSHSAESFAPGGIPLPS